TPKASPEGSWLDYVFNDLGRRHGGEQNEDVASNLGGTGWEQNDNVASDLGGAGGEQNEGRASDGEQHVVDSSSN
ncbi:hypothetical protein FCV25MIE_29795, partial [Fagus crenata]